MVANFKSCEELRTIPASKVIAYKKSIIAKCSTCSKIEGITEAQLCSKCVTSNKIFDRYVSANIPMDFIDRYMKDFLGDINLKKYYDRITSDIVGEFVNGKSYCVLGQHGTGKTMFATNILKYAALKGYSALYSTFNDIVSTSLYSQSKSKHECRKELILTDFLCIDEFDSRFISNDSSGELFGRILESILRVRFQNKLPTIILSNDTKLTEKLGDKLNASLSSLLIGYTKAIYVMGGDQRKEGLCSSSSNSNK